jgi:hypothetical protein
MELHIMQFPPATALPLGLCSQTPSLGVIQLMRQNGLGTRKATGKIMLQLEEVRDKGGSETANSSVLRKWES